MNILIKGNILYDELSKPIVRTALEIKKYLVIDGEIIIVLTAPEKIKTKVSNISAYTLQGKLMWVAEFPKSAYEPNENYYVGIEYQDSILIAYSIQGIEFILDIKTGHLLSSELIK